MVLSLLPLLAWGNERAVDGTLHSAVAELLKTQGMQGAAWATVADNGTIAADAAGVRDARTNAALRADDRVHVGSVAKTLLATGVLRLVTEGRLTLDTPVSALLPSVTFDNPWESDHPVRIRHLLDHTAGLEDAPMSRLFSLQARADAPLVAALEGRTLHVRSRPGSRHSYSNTGYTLMGMVIEAVTGARYEAYLDAHLLRPLGMRNSTFAFTTQEGAHADRRLAMGHFEAGVTQAAVPMYLRPAGQFTTTASDMGRFARFLMSDGRIEGRPFVDATLLKAMGRPAASEAALAGLRVGYGLGLATRDRHGAVGKCHGGSTVGYRAMLCLFPDNRRAFFIAINTDHDGADYGQFDRLLIEALDLPKPPSAQRTTASADATPWEGYYIPAPNRYARLEWIDTTLNFVRVTSSGASLRFSPFQSPAVELVSMGGALFRASDRTSASHAALITTDGSRAITTGLQTYQRVPLIALAALWISLVAGVLGLGWLLIMGVVRIALSRRTWWKRPAALPFLGIVSLMLPVPLFLRQSFLAMGDLTLASGMLAVVTLLLPLTMVSGLVLSLRRRPWSAASRVDVVAMAAVLQWTLVLAWWGLMPVRLWS
ncbi:serine hydrolase domain-containing protein [Lysobacter niastensis]|uniref:Beta-lactamase family protein n=1 Tax=Lysobacter niastensis TaxID=380629 RepID=A0ABS0BB46_9GAMM|nr:serine hydrolase domain-containing protein [Lysobacter niastensis]MBF6025102.1 beta-lactamase family protein [Lysobacter niastensis]